jgi:hypothetical protein
MKFVIFFYSKKKKKKKIGPILLINSPNAKNKIKIKKTSIKEIYLSIYRNIYLKYVLI